ncbi:hypothetical protein C0075_13970 [Rhizobium sp. KAs_5_22]|nr:hypothetical protein C0075_13970 [Rhizobium sp. KAs_5_22]
MNVLNATRRAKGLVFACGAAGLGKSFAAKLLAGKDDINWGIVYFRDLTANETAARLSLLIGELASRPAKNLILDDLNEANAPIVRDLLTRVIALARRRDVTIVFTSYVAPPASVLHRLGCDVSAVVEIPYFDETEVAELVELAGGDPKYAGPVFRVASRGHPQLTIAAVMYLSSVGWSRKAISEILTEQVFEEIDAERDAVRSRLLSAMPPEAQHLLFRASVIHGSFDRDLGVALGAILPVVAFPGLVLDRLIGPWIEVIGQDRFRISPLLSGTAEKVFSVPDQKAIHSFIATSLLERDSISVLDSGMLMHHALGSADPSLIFAFATSVITCGVETLDLLAPFIADIAQFSLNFPISPGEPTLSVMMRLAQLLALLPYGSAAEAQACFAVLEQERGEVDENGNFERTMLTKVLLHPRAGELFPNWIDLLVRLDDLTNLAGRLEGMRQIVQSKTGIDPHVCGILLACQMQNIRRVADFHQLMIQLDREPAERRDRFLSSYQPGRGDISILVNYGWMKEGRDPEFDWSAAADLYAAAAKIAFSWENRMLATRCAIAQAICYDENGRDPDLAISCLEDADRRFGFDIAIVRAKAKVLWRRKDHAAALPLLSAAADQGGQDQIERAYIAREAGISAAELGEWANARTWFERARTAAAGIDLPVVKAMAIGLIADSAHAAYQAGEPNIAVSKLKDALQQVQQLDADGSLSEAYCHRIIRHAVLWIYDQLTGGRVSLFQATHYTAGCASNPEPNEAIRTHPLGDIDFAFYLLADVDELLSNPTGFHREFRRYLNRGPILSYEIKRNFSEDCRAIAEHDTSNIVWRIRRHVALNDFMTKHVPGSNDEDLANPTRGSIEPFDLISAPASLLMVAEDYLITFMFAAVIAGNIGAVSHAATAGLQTQEIAGLHPLLERMAGTVTIEARSDREGAASTIHLLGKGAVVAPLEIWWSGAWMLIHLRSSNLRQCLNESVVNWIFESWERIVRDQRFRLKAPSINVPPIESCLAQNDRTLGGATRLIFAAAPGAAAKIAPIREVLVELLNQSDGEKIPCP